jgi:hypothetical protein
LGGLSGSLGSGKCPPASVRPYSSFSRRSSLSLLVTSRRPVGDRPGSPHRSSRRSPRGSFGRKRLVFVASLVGHSPFGLRAERIRSAIVEGRLTVGVSAIASESDRVRQADDSLGCRLLSARSRTVTGNTRKRSRKRRLNNHYFSLSTILHCHIQPRHVKFC